MTMIWASVFLLGAGLVFLGFRRWGVAAFFFLAALFTIVAAATALSVGSG